MKKLIPIISLLLVACGQSSKPKDEVIYVSIAPLRYVVEQIASPGTRVEVLVPETTSPESYEPTVQQIKALADARLYISTGLIDFEQALAGKIGDIAPNTVILDLSEGVETVAGHCGHGHDDHHHGVDPHIWLSPRIVKQMGGSIATQLQQLHPDSAQVFQQRTEQFAAQIDSLDNHIRQALGGTQRNSFAIGHTSLTYFANDYGLRQIAIENEGKEPSVKTMKQLVDSLQRLGVKGVLYQRQTSDAAAQTIARELPGGHAIEFDPLAPDWLSNMYRLADSLQVILNE